MMKILNVVPFMMREGGGLVEAVAGLTSAEHELGIDVSIATMASSPSSAGKDRRLEGIPFHEGHVTGPLVPGLSFDFHRILDPLIDPGTIVHIHSLWTYGGYAAARMARRKGARLAFSPHGCLMAERLIRRPFQKKLFTHLYQRRQLKQADWLVAASEYEAEGFARYGLRNPVVVAPCGVDFSSLDGDGDGDAFRKAHGIPPDVPLLLSLSRLEGVKGIDLLIEAFAPLDPLWHLVLAGPDEGGTQALLERQVARLGLTSRVHFVGPVWGKEKRDAFAAAELFVLCSLGENFGITVAEALYTGLPVVTTDCTAWRHLPEIEGGWIARGNDPIAFRRELVRAMATPPTRRREMADAGRRWVVDHCNWLESARILRDTFAR